MRTLSLTVVFLLICGFTLSALPKSNAPTQPNSGQEAKAKREQFAANAFLPRGAGRRMVGAGTLAPVDIHINEYSSDEEIRRLAGILIDGGPELLQKALEKMDPKGRINLTGRVGFYNLKAIRSRPTATGRRIIAITDRPMGFLEMYFANPSQDYRTGILILDLIKNKKGKEEGHGSLLYAAKLRIENNILQVEHYSIEPVSLRNVRKW